MSNALVTVADMDRMAQAIAKSGLFGMKTPEQALALMVVAQAEGRHPGSVASEYHIIQGRPALKADAMLARFQQAGGRVEWHDYTDAKVSATFSHPQGGSVTVDWDLARAHAAKLTGKDNWKSYPRAMLRSRVISEGIRTCYPGVCIGTYTVEEVMDMPADERDITPTAGVLGALPAATQEAVIETAQQVKAMLANDQTQDAYTLWQDSRFDADQEVAFWSLLDSKQRSMLKRLQDAEKAVAAGTISPAQKKRLEARIKELGLDRDYVKEYVKTFGVAHFQDLTREQYEALDKALETLPLDRKATAPAGHPPAPPAQAVPAAVAPNAAGQSTTAAISESERLEDTAAPAAPDPARDKLAAAGSMGALAKAWADIGQEARSRLAAFKDECKDRILQADKEVTT